MVNGTGISFSGLASGLDTQAIVQQLVAIERIPITLIEAQKAEQEDRLSSINQLADLVKAMQAKAETLSTSDGFFDYSVGGSFDGYANITASGGAAEGTHTLEVQKLAGIDRWAFDGVADPDVELAGADGQQVAFEIGTTSYSVVVNQVDSSLNDIADAINDAAAGDVHASVVNTGTSSSPSYQLVLAAKESGSDSRITNIASDITGLTIAYSPPDAQGEPTSANHLTVGDDAVAVIDGLTITRSSNDFGDVYEGVAIDLQGITAGAVNFTIEPDRESVRAKIDEFVTAYNDVIGFINTQNTFTPSSDESEPGTSGVLFGDSVLRSVRGGMRTALFDVDVDTVIADTTGYVTLAQLGIAQGTDGTLTIDDAKFDEKLAEDITLFADLFIDTDGFVRDPNAAPNTPEYYEDISVDRGLMANLVREIDRMFGSLPDENDDIELQGIFDLKRDTIGDQIQRFNDQIEQRERRLGEYEEDLILRFARLEELMGALNAQGAALTNALNQF